MTAPAIAPTVVTNAKLTTSLMKGYISTAIHILLIILTLIGIFGAGSVSYADLTGRLECPTIATLPVCYLVLAAYVLMLISLILKHKQTLFYIGWGTATVIALINTFAEITTGNICPKTSGGTPNCYISLALLVIIIFLFVISRGSNKTSATLRQH